MLASVDHDQIAWALLKETTDEAALRRFTEQYPHSLLRRDAEARIAALAAAQAAKPVAPGPDELTWALLKETTDEAALRRFTEQYPNSLLRRDAEERIAALAAAQAAKPVAPGPDEVTWAWLKETTDKAALKRFVTQYPNSTLRKDAEARVSALEANSATTGPVTQIDHHELVRSLQIELKRVGCFDGLVNGEFNDATRAASQTFAKLSLTKIPDDLTPDAIRALRGIDRRVCPLVCRDGERPAGDHCITIAVPHRAEPQRTAPQKIESRNGGAKLLARPRPDGSGFATAPTPAAPSSELGAWFSPH
jgi:hypothetical protein